MNDTERIAELERLVKEQGDAILFLLQYNFRVSKMFLSPMGDGTIGKELLDKFKLKQGLPKT